MSAAFSVMGVVNATPDSFSDGGLYLDADAALARASELIAEGADIVDVGGESTRPGAEPVSVGEELRRVIPVIEQIAARIGATHAGAGAGSGAGAGLEAGAGGRAARISIDTSKSAVARAALEAGAHIVNDITALRADPLMTEVVAEADCECVLMHMLGSPRTMQSDPRYVDVVDDVRAFLIERMEHAVRAGVREERIVLDPGIGFGKTVAHNLELLRRLDELVALGRPVLVGTSRKSFLGRLIAESAGTQEPASPPAPPPNERLPGTIATNVLAYARGASIFRVHDVASVRAALAVAAATLNSP